jgi:hypothetical protein
MTSYQISIAGSYYVKAELRHGWPRAGGVPPFK